MPPCRRNRSAQPASAADRRPTQPPSARLGIGTPQFFYSIKKEGDSRIFQAQELEAGEAEEISKAA